MKRLKGWEAGKTGRHPASSCGAAGVKGSSPTVCVMQWSWPLFVLQTWFDARYLPDDLTSYP